MNVFVDVNSKSVKLSMILKWYEVDFGKNKKEVLQSVHDHLAQVHAANNLFGKK